MSKQNLFAKRVYAVKQNAIRKTIPLIRQPGVVSFAGGWPDPALFPTEAIKEIVAHIMDTEPHIALQYGASAGDSRLRRWLAERMQARNGMNVSEHEVMITAGSQQGIFLTNALLIEKGDVIAVESPSFVGAFASMEFFEGERVGVAMDEHGLDTDAFEVLLKQKKIKYAYVIPDFQNPTGRTMSLARRKRLVELAELYDFMILEDSPYSELRYEGSPVPPIHSLDPNGRTIHLGSFSKTFSPMRVGWLVAPPEFVERMTPIKQSIDTNTSALTQSLVYHFCQQGLLDEQIGQLNAAYKRKRDLMFATFDRYMPSEVNWTSPEGGMFVWLTLPEHVDASDVFLKAIDAKIAVVAGNGFYPDEANSPKNEMRVNWVSPSEQQIQDGMKTLADVIKNAL
ncbi:MAG: PLP-dependent aminotransferase family protein [Candidatus Promineifilaceae bacterium]